MRRVGRIAARVGAGLIGFAVLLWVVCLDGVDYEPYFRTAYYKETVDRLGARAATNVIASGELSAGFGKARLTPVVQAELANAKEGKFKQMPLAGYGNREGKPATGVHDDLNVKAAAIRVGGNLGIMFGVDALIVPREVADRAAAMLQESHGLRREQLYFSATHTHCSLGGWGEGIVGELFAGEFDPGAVEWFAECIVKAGRAAVEDLKPAEIAQGSFSAPEFVRNRLVGELGKVNPEFAFAVIQQKGGTRGVLGSFGAHATVLLGREMEFSADYPGQWQRAMESESGGIAIFLAGSVGSHGPVPGGKGHEGAERMGKGLAAKLIEELGKVSFTNKIDFGMLSTEVELPPLNVRVLDGTRLRPWVSQKLLPPNEGSFVQGFRIGKRVWISTPCDFSGELALDIKDYLAMLNSHR